MADGIEITQLVIDVDSGGVITAVNRLDRLARTAENVDSSTSLMVRGFSDLSAAVILATGAIDSLLSVSDTWVEFDKKIRNTANLTGSALEDMSSAAIDSGLSWGRFAGDVAEAFGVVGSKTPALLEAPEALKAVTEQSLELADAAKATGDAMSDADAAMAITAGLNQWGVATKDAVVQADRFGDVLAAGAQLGSASISDVVASMKASATIAATAGVQIEGYTATLQILAEKQIIAGEAGTGLRNVIGFLLTQGEKFKEFGIQGVDATLKTEGLAAALKKLAPIQSNTTALTKIFGQENVVVAQILAQNAQSVDELAKKLTGTNTAAEQAAAGQKTFSTQLEATHGLLKTLVAVSFDSFVSDFAADSLKDFNELIKETIKLLRSVEETETFASVVYELETLRENLEPTADFVVFLFDKIADGYSQLGGFLNEITSEFSNIADMIGISDNAAVRFVESLLQGRTIVEILIDAYDNLLNLGSAFETLGAIAGAEIIAIRGFFERMWYGTQKVAVSVLGAIIAKIQQVKISIAEMQLSFSRTLLSFAEEARGLSTQMSALGGAFDGLDEKMAGVEQSARAHWREQKKGVDEAKSALDQHNATVIAQVSAYSLAAKATKEHTQTARMNAAAVAEQHLANVEATKSQRESAAEARNTAKIFDELDRENEKLLGSGKKVADVLDDIKPPDPSIPKPIEKLGKAAGSATKSVSDLERAMERAADEVMRMWENLSEETATIRMDEIEKKTWKLAEAMKAAGATPEQINAATEKFKIQLEQNEAIEEEIKLQNQLLEEKERELESDKKTLENLRQEIEYLGIVDEKLREKKKFIDQIDPSMREQADILYEQREAAERANEEYKEAQQIWDDLGNQAGDFLGDLLNMGEAGKGFGKILGGILGDLGKSGGLLGDIFGGGSGLGGILGGDLSGSLGSIAQSIGGALGIGGGVAASTGAATVAGGAGSIASGGAALTSGVAAPASGGLAGAAGGAMAAAFPALWATSMFNVLSGGFNSPEIARSGIRAQISGGAVTANEFDSLGGTPSEREMSLFGGAKFRITDLREVDQEIQEQLDSAFSSINQTIGGLGELLGANLLDALHGFESTIFSGAGEELANWFSMQSSRMMVFAVENIEPTTDFIESLQSQVSELKESAQGLSDDDAIAGVIARFAELKTAFESAGLQGDNISNTMIAAAGGFDSLASASSHFLSEFYGETEKGKQQFSLLKEQMGAAFSALGVEVPKSKEEFKNLVTGIDLSTESNQKLFGSIIQLSKPFSKYIELQEQLTDSVDGASEGTGLLAKSIENLKETITSENIGKMLIDSVTSAKNADEAGKRFSDSLANSITHQMQSTFASQVSSIVFNSIVAPMLAAGSISSENLSNAVSKVKSAANLMAQAMPAITEAFASISPSLEEIGETTFNVVGSNKNYNKSITSVAESTATATKSTIDYANEIMRLQRELTLGGMAEGIERDLMQLRFSYEDALIKAADSGQLLLLTTEKYEQDKLHIFEKYAEIERKRREEIVESLTNLQDELAISYLGAASEAQELSDFLVHSGFSARDAAKAINELDADALQSIIDSTGKTKDELIAIASASISAMDTIGKFRISLIEAAGENSPLTTAKRILLESGLAADVFAKEISKMNPEDLDSAAKSLGITRAELMAAAVDVTHGLASANEKFSNFKDEIVGVETPLERVKEQLLRSGMSAGEFAKEISKLSEPELQQIAGQLTTTRDELMAAALDVKKALEEMAKAAGAMNSDLQTQIDAIGLEGKELELFNLDKWRVDTKTKAEEIGADLALVEELYGLKRAEILEKYSKDGTSSVESEMSKLASSIASKLKTLAGGALSALKSAVDAQKKELDDSLKSELSAIEEVHKARISYIDEEKDRITSNLSFLEDISNSLHNAIGGVLVESEAAKRARRQSAQSTIASALSSVRSGGQFSDSEGLKDALSTVSSGDSKQFFGSFQDYVRDTVRTASQIAELASTTDSQISVEEKMLLALQSQRESTISEYENQRNLLQEHHDKQISALDGILADGQEQINAAYGISEATESVESAVMKVRNISELISSAQDAGVQLQQTSLEAQYQQIALEIQQHAQLIGAVYSIPNAINNAISSYGGQQAPNTVIPNISVPVNTTTNTDVTELKREIMMLRDVLQHTQTQIINNGNDNLRILKRWDLNGLPEERTT